MILTRRNKLHIIGTRGAMRLIANRWHPTKSKGPIVLRTPAPAVHKSRRRFVEKPSQTVVATAERETSAAQYGTQLEACSNKSCAYQPQHQQVLYGGAEFPLVCSKSASSPLRSSVGEGGQPRICRSTCMTFDRPPATA